MHNKRQDRKAYTISFLFFCSSILLCVLVVCGGGVVAWEQDKGNGLPFIYTHTRKGIPFPGYCRDLTSIADILLYRLMLGVPKTLTH